VPEGARRPLWSVMIPTFNCAQYLVQCLESVLAEDPGTDTMHIEVVDDCSTTDDPEAVVKKVGRGRVLFHRKNRNEGATQNFNTCVKRSLGHLVHILHGDDWILPGFYSCIANMAKANPNTSFFACRSFLVSEEGLIVAVEKRLPELEKGRDGVHH